MAVVRPVACLASSPLWRRMPRRHALRFHSRRFGRRPAMRAVAQPLPAKRINEDLRLFAVTFSAGFLFVSLLIA